jgi:hypothetical protein
MKLMASARALLNIVRRPRAQSGKIKYYEKRQHASPIHNSISSLNLFITRCAACAMHTDGEKTPGAPFKLYLSR